MKLRTQNFTMFSGDDKTLKVTVRDETGAVVDLTGATIKWELAKSASSETSKITKSTGSGITITDATNGIFEISVDPGDTSDLCGLFYHEAEVTDSSSQVTTVMAGNATISTDLIT